MGRNNYVQHENLQCIRGTLYEHMHVSRVVAPLTFWGQDSGILTWHPDIPARFASIFHMLKSSVCESHSPFAPRRYAVLVNRASCYKPVVNSNIAEKEANTFMQMCIIVKCWNTVRCLTFAPWRPHSRNLEILICDAIFRISGVTFKRYRLKMIPSWVETFQFLY